jgi:hypoxanthine phosphoribosyltransferase
MPELIPVLNKDDINKKVEAVAERISFDYQDRKLLLIGVLKGSFVFLADLIRFLTIPVEIDFIGTASYGTKSVSSGNIRLTKKITAPLSNKDVLIVEDIVDTGLTLAFLTDHINSFGPNSVKTCTFIDKPERRKIEINVDYCCHKVDEGFLVGYGLDYNEQYRELSDLYHLKI